VGFPGPPEWIASFYRISSFYIAVIFMDNDMGGHNPAMLTAEWGLNGCAILALDTPFNQEDVTEWASNGFGNFDKN